MCSLARHIGLTSLSLSTLLRTLKSCVQEHFACLHGALRLFLLYCATADDVEMLSCSQLNLCLELTKEPILFVNGTRVWMLCFSPLCEP
ncbi:TPA: hypothetical protein ACH3X2_002911 [Trebouxia sp. C0005]